MVTFKSYWDDKVILFTNPKVGSRVCDKWFTQNVMGNISIHPNSIKKLPYHIPEEWNGEVEKEKLNEYKDVIDSCLDKKKNTRDIFFLYRKPETKLLSGLYQEFTSWFQSADDISINYLARRYKNPKSVIDLCRLRNHDFDWHNLPHDFEWSKFERTIFTNLANDFVNGVTDNHSLFNLNHCVPTLTPIYTIINSNLFDNNKIKIVDIENNNLDDIFGKWKSTNEQPINRGVLKNKFIFEEICKVANNDTIRNYIEQGLQYEKYFYELLLSLKNNIKL